MYFYYHFFYYFRHIVLKEGALPQLIIAWVRQPSNPHLQPKQGQTSHGAPLRAMMGRDNNIT